MVSARLNGSVVSERKHGQCTDLVVVMWCKSEWSGCLGKKTWPIYRFSGYYNLMVSARVNGSVVGTRHVCIVEMNITGRWSLDELQLTVFVDFQVHDSYAAFRSQNLILDVSLETAISKLKVCKVMERCAYYEQNVSPLC